jgi:hypothetical protein
MFFDIDSANKTFVIDGNNPIYRNSDYQGSDFELYALPCKRSNLKKYRRSAMTKEGLDQDIYLSMIWRNHIQGWKLKGKGGKEIPYSESNKEKLLEEFPVFTNLSAQACIDVQIREEIEHEEQVEKNLKPSGSGE